MPERPITTHATITRGGEPVTEATLLLNTIGIEITWNGAHTVTSRLVRDGNDWTPTALRSDIGCCSIGDWAQEEATLDDFLRCVREFEQDPFHHPLWTG